jgi:hypothetical protein
VKTVAVTLFGGIGAAFLVAAVVALCRRDDAPKLVVDEVGLTDHRCKGGPRRVEWADVQSMDCNVMAARGVVKAKVNLYVATGDRLDEVKVDVGGLGSPATKVFGLMKKLWLQFNYRRGIGPTDGEGD